jgi:hypothetical protein
MRVTYRKLPPQIVVSTWRMRSGHESSFDEEAFFSFSEAELLELSGESSDGLVAHGLLACVSLLGLEGVELGGLVLALLFEAVDEALLGPAALGSEIAEGAELAVCLQSEDLEGLGDDDALLVVVGEGDTLEDLKATESGGTLGLLMSDHTTDTLPHESGGGLVMDKVTTGVRIVSSVGDFLSLESVSEERARDVDFVAADNNDALTGDELLSDDTGETTEHVTTSINDNFLFEHA